MGLGSPIGTAFECLAEVLLDSAVAELVVKEIYSRFSRSFTARGYLLGNPPGYKANKL